MPNLKAEDLHIIDPIHFAERGYPYEEWDRLRREAPVFYHDAWKVPFWAVTTHEDICHIGKHPEIFLNEPMLMIGMQDEEELGDFQRPRTLIEMDPPQHGESRSLIGRRFTPGAMRKLHADIERIAKKIVDDLLTETDEGEVDFVERVAAPLPIAVIGWLLGVPEEDWPLLFDWTNRSIGSDDPDFKKKAEAEGKEVGLPAIIEMMTYFAGLIEERRKNPKDDLITMFATADLGGQKLTDIDVLAWCQIITIAGNETTRNGTSGGMLALIEHPQAIAQIQQDPELLKPAIEEILRWTSPIIHFARTASQDTEIRGQKIKKGDHLAIYFPSANRDEAVFDDPYAFKIDRPQNRHLAFGVGEHFCAGAHVARLEIEMAFKYLLPRLESIELAGEPARLQSNLIGGIKRLPIRYKLRAAA